MNHDHDQDQDTFVVYADHYTWGSSDPITEDEHEAACARAEAWLTEHEGDLSISVRPCYPGCADGIYAVRPSGDLQYLGCSVPVPGTVWDLWGRAWEHALQTWADTTIQVTMQDLCDTYGVPRDEAPLRLDEDVTLWLDAEGWHVSSPLADADWAPRDPDQVAALRLAAKGDL